MDWRAVPTFIIIYPWRPSQNSSLYFQAKKAQVRVWWGGRILVGLETGNRASVSDFIRSKPKAALASNGYKRWGRVQRHLFQSSPIITQNNRQVYFKSISFPSHRKHSWVKGTFRWPFDSFFKLRLQWFHGKAAKRLMVNLAPDPALPHYRLHRLKMRVFLFRTMGICLLPWLAW